MTDDQFCKWTDLLERRAGIRVSLERKSFLVTNIGLRMKEVSRTNVDEYYNFLVGEDSNHEWSVLIDKLTVHETRFLRHKSSFDLYTKKILPELKKRSGEFWHHTCLSLGCSTGEEVYTLAMFSTEYSEKIFGGNNFTIYGVDISESVVAVASQGKYQPRSLVNLEEHYLDKYFSLEKGAYRVKESLKLKTKFISSNALELNKEVPEELEVAFCQNMLIYFSKENRLRILDELVSRIKVGGFLVLGIGEGRGWENDFVERVDFPDTLAYKKIG